MAGSRREPGHPDPFPADGFSACARRGSGPGGAAAAGRLPLGAPSGWDDTAALYLLAPEDFAAKGAHLEPAIDEETLRSELVKAINATPSD